MKHSNSHHNRTLVLSGMVVLIMICLGVLAGCSTTPPDQRLMTGTPTVTPGGPGYQGRGSIAPILVNPAQSSLATYPGGFMTLTITTSPFAVCNFVVYYGLKKPSQETGIVPRTADVHGNTSWHWRVESSAHTGSWPVTLTATLPNGAQSKENVSVFVTGAPIKVVSSQLVAYPNGPMKLAIATAPSIKCLIAFALGPSGDVRSLNSQSDQQGMAFWKWTVGKKAVPGVWPMTITAILADGEQSTITVNVTVLAPKH